MLSLRSLAFILASAIRRARALSCAALQSLPDTIETKIATKIAIKMDTRMATVMVQSPTNKSTLKATARGRKGPTEGMGRFGGRKLLLGRRLVGTRVGPGLWERGDVDFGV